MTPIMHPQYGREFGVDHLSIDGIVSFAGDDDGDVYYRGAIAGTYPGYIATATELELGSDAAADDVGSTGALEVTVTGLLADYSLETEVFAMNGVAAVAGAVEFLRVLKVEVTDVGSDQVNAGNITIRAVADVPIMSYIPAGAGKSWDAAGCVPAGYSFYVVHFSCSINALTATEVQLKVRQYDLGGWHIVDRRYIYLGGISEHDRPMKYPMLIPAKADLKVYADVAAAAKVSAHVMGYLVAN